MDVSRVPNEPLFDLSAQPFRLLRVDPTAAKAQIDDAFDVAQRNGTAPFPAIIRARDALLNPERRLSCELAYPLDCPESEIESLYVALTENASTQKLLHFSNQLWPLGRANFVTHIAGQRPASGALLYALIESHAAIDATDIYERLQTARSSAGIPAPAFLSVNQGLTELLEIHAAAVLVGYEPIQKAAVPVLECTLKTLATDESHLIEALGRLLSFYHRAVGPARIDAAAEIESASAALQQQPNDSVAMERLGKAVRIWTSLCRPLLLWNADQPEHELEFDSPIQALRALIGQLCEDKHYQVAVDVTAASREIFAAVPTTIDDLAEDARLAAGLFFYANIKQLQELINKALSDPGPYIAALEKDGFGSTSSEPVQSLWMTFVSATARPGSGSVELPRRMVHELALRLSNRPEAAAAVTALLVGLIRHGEKTSARPATLKELHNNLRFMLSFLRSEEGPENSAASPAPAAKRSTSPNLLARLRGRAVGRLLTLGPGQRKYRAGFAVLVFVPLSMFILYRHRDQLDLLWSELLEVATSQQSATTLGVQTMPPVGTGQHLDEDGVRYCYFQKERLRVIKQMTEGPEDARSYNLLIVDYNSRCSDFFYKDEDLKQVLAEVGVNKPLLDAEAKQIVSTWPRHGTQALKN
jgi:hypothetical protein